MKATHTPRQILPSCRICGSPNVDTANLEIERDRLLADNKDLRKALENVELENVELRDAQAKISSTICKEKDRAKFLHSERDRLLAENKALRGALEMIRDSDEFMGGTFVKELQHIARDALAKASHD